MKVGIFLGGKSREREISFAGGRTVYDNLDKILFTTIPIFVDSYGNFIQLEWAWLYKGTIRDFYPPARFVPESEKDFQVYLEHIDKEDGPLVKKCALQVGKIIRPDELNKTIDIAFLTLHGLMGEDGTLQGMLEWLGIPYTGTGILGSAIGINKLTQKNLMPGFQFPLTPYVVIYAHEMESRFSVLSTYIRTHLGYPCVVKSPVQGSSIGLSIVHREEDLPHAFNHALMRKVVSALDWNAKDAQGKIQWIREYTDIRQQPGLPARILEQQDNTWIHKPSELLTYLDNALSVLPAVTLEAMDAGTCVLVEKYLEGQEFSVIVIEDEQGHTRALPPTGIYKAQEVYDYRSKYLPGIARKITPVDLPEDVIRMIMRESERLMNELGFSVYARIDGYYQEDGSIYLNDPNTTSGMLPGSFFFHQAAEIGLDPSAFLTYIIFASLKARIRESVLRVPSEKLLKRLEADLLKREQQEDIRIPVAVVLGGYSSERHISVESGRNIYEKLSSSGIYAPIPLFLMSSEVMPEELRSQTEAEPGCGFSLWRLPVNMMLKDNADDIRDEILHLYAEPALHPVIRETRARTEKLTQKFSVNPSAGSPEPIRIARLAEEVSFVFIGLHGRPGEDGHIQSVLEQYALPYNGSGVNVSRITIDKFATISRLKAWGMKGAQQRIITKSEWQKDPQLILKSLASVFPVIAKPADDGCSSAVKKIKNPEILDAYIQAIFRETELIPQKSMEILGLSAGEEFPRKDFFLLESLQAKDDKDIHFLEVTVGLLTHFDESGKMIYEVFEPSETLAGDEILSLEEKFLAGEGQNITPARFDPNPKQSAKISRKVRRAIKDAAILLDIQGYARIDAFVHIRPDEQVEVEFIEVNSLPGMTPATCIFHQCALAGYTPFDFIDRIIQQGMSRYKVKA